MLIEDEEEEEEGMNMTDGEEVQSPGSKSYLWDVFLYLRLPEKNKHQDREALIKISLL